QVSEHDQQHQHGDHAREHVLLLPVTELVGEHGQDLRFTHLRQQRIEKHHPLLTTDAGEVRVGVRTATRGVYLEHPSDVDPGALGERVNALTQTGNVERLHAIEERLDQVR